jgi:hypothetical protein
VSSWGKELGTGLAVDVEDALNLDSSMTVFRETPLCVWATTNATGWFQLL